MRLIKVKLVNYKLLRLNMIDSIEFTPSAPTQFITGTNGAGKSAFIRECSLLPPDKNDYDKGGSKLAVFQEGNNIYRAFSYEKDGDWHHSFKLNDKELNEGHTISVQNDLIKSYTKYTHELHELITGGTTRFTGMSFADRRKWFTYLANSNLDYAVGVYKRITEKYNESRHALKRAKENLVSETLRLLPPDELEQLRNMCSDLYEQAQKLIEIRKPLIDPSHTYLERANKAAEHYNGVAIKTRALVKRLQKMPSELPRSERDIQDAIATAKATMGILQEQSNRFYEDNERIQRLWDSMQATKLENAAQIQQQLDDCKSTIEESKKACVLPMEQTASAAITIASCDKLLDWWPNVQSGFHDNTERGWGRNYLETLNTEIDAKQDVVSKLGNLIARYEQTIEHHESHKGEDSINCPKCSHSFQPNFSTHIYNETMEKLQAARINHAKLYTELREKLDHREVVQKYLQHYSMVMQQLRNYPGLENFTAWIAKEYILVNHPNSFSGHLSRFRDQAGHWQRIELAETKMNEILALSSQLSERDNGGISVAEERERLERLIGDCEFNKSQTQAKLESLNGMLQIVTGIQDLGAQLQKGIDTVDNFHLEAADSLRRETFAQILRELQQQLNIKESALMAAERQQSVIEHIQSEIVDLEQRTHDYKILQKELSPTEGMIAEGMVGFINVFIDQMNKTCEQFFSYPLRVLPCGIDSNTLNLNYKFPIMVDKDKRPDVSKGSSGMREVFDLAFVKATMKAMGLGSWPLFLDEFGKGLDPVHKRATISLITSMMELESYEQIFMISHSVAEYSGIGRSELLVLHESNVILPPNASYNKHVIINGR